MLIDLDSMSAYAKGGGGAPFDTIMAIDGGGDPMMRAYESPSPPP